MPDSTPSPDLLPQRPVVAGKFFRRGDKLWTMHGLTYGPFFGADGLPVLDRAAQDLTMIAAWGANAVRLYTPPPEWFLDLCAERGLSVVTGVAWTDHIDFLRSSASRKEAILAVRETARRLANRHEVAALLVGNEIKAPLVRWLGSRGVERFLETLIDAARQEAPDLLLAYANYSTTEYLQPANADFTAFNVYLETPEAFDSYLARLQNIAGDQPLVISEFGVDAKARSQEKQAGILTWQQRLCLERGVAGNLLFSFTDEWHREGEEVKDVQFGLTDRNRARRMAWHVLAGGPPVIGELLPPKPPRVSLIVCTRNGGHTLPECLNSIARIEYPDLEAIVVDDGSTQDIAAIASQYPDMHYIRQEAQGLAVARNTGTAAATGEIIAYTDDDCVVDASWLIHLTRAFDRPEVGAAGGPNIPPAPTDRSQACVIAAPGGPAHVLLTDTTAEHIPGCNMAVRRSAFDDIGGFDPKYHAAGDDVDFCWRLQEKGYVIAFSAAAMVWHYRRSTLREYLRQQAGYGKGEALLISQYRARFSRLGGALWRGVIYRAALHRLTHHAGRIYSGVFGSAPWQPLYRGPVPEPGWLIAGFPWWLLTIIIAMNALWLPAILWLAALMAAVPLVYTMRQAMRLPLARPWGGMRTRILLWVFLLAQPVVRGWNRFAWNVRLGSWPGGPWLTPGGNPRPRQWFYKRVADLELQSAEGQDRNHLIEALMLHLRNTGAPAGTGDGWRDWDLETVASRWWRVRFSIVTEYHGGGDCLTRVRIASRATAICMMVFGLLLAAAAGLIFVAGWHPVWVLGTLFVGSILFESLHHAAITRAANKVVSTATTAGFQPVGRASEAEGKKAE